MTSSKSKSPVVLSTIISFMALSGFIIIALLLTWSKGICCADDAYLSIIAKNLANGLGYTSTIQPFVSRYTLQSYDPLVGTGPTIILPASLSIKFFGNTYWAPGLANVTLWSVLLVLIGMFLRKYNHGMQFSLFTFSFLYLGFALMTYHFEHWYALLGEVPAALLVVLGMLCFLDDDTRLNQVLTGVLFSLAFESKLLALIAIGVFVIVHVPVYIRGQAEDYPALIKKSMLRIFYMGLGFAFPLALFELWKFFSMGPSEFIENWREYTRYIGSDGARLNQSSLRELYAERSGILMDRFGVPLSNVGLVLAAGWLLINRDDKLKRLFFLLIAIVALYSFWWVFLSIGWARYFIICLILIIFAISLPLLSSRPKSYVFLYAMLIIFFSSNNWARLEYPFEDLNGEFFRPTSHTEGLLETSMALSQQVRFDDERIATQWWATAADIEYIMDTPLNFTTFRDAKLKEVDSFWVAVNTRFMGKEDHDFADLLAGCTDIQEKSVYIIARCEVKVPK